MPDNNIVTSDAVQTQNSFTMRNRKTEWNSKGKIFFEKYDNFRKKFEPRLDKLRSPLLIFRY